MEPETGPIALRQDAMNYIKEFKIEQMFESLVAALVVEKPEDHFTFLDSTITKIKEKNNNVNWESFVHHLHPQRDPARLKILGLSEKDLDSSLHRIEREKAVSPYQPEFFKLTES